AVMVLTSPDATPVRAIVRRGTGRLAFRGGQVVRNPGELLPSGALRGKVICVGAGHGGFSPGAAGLNGLPEHGAGRAVALELAAPLRGSGATVIMPRSDDTYASLDGRIDFANTQSADLFVSIHCNAMPVHNTVNGTETYYDTPQSADLARTIHPLVVGVVGE